MWISSSHGIKVDFLLTPNLTGHPPALETIAGLEVPVDTIPEIIAKKLRYRLRELRPRDIFDAAVALERDAGLLERLLDKRAVTIDELYEWKVMLSGHR